MVMSANPDITAAPLVCSDIPTSYVISSRTSNFIAMALAAARQSRYRHRLGAVICSGGRVKGVGWSKKRNNPSCVSEQHLKDCSIHAEIDALRGLKDLKRATCFVARLDRQDQAVLAKPCNACWGVLVERGITKVYYTTGSDTIGCQDVTDG